MGVLCDLHARGYGCNEAEELDGGTGRWKGLNWGGGGLGGGQTLKTTLHLNFNRFAEPVFFGTNSLMLRKRIIKQKNALKGSAGKILQTSYESI